LRTRLAELATEAAELRSFRRPPHQATMAEVHEAVLEARGRLDRLEEIRISTGAIKRATAGGQLAAEERAKDAWDACADRDKNRQAREYEGAEERYARWRLETLLPLQTARQARVLAEQAAQVADDVATRYFGLKDTQREMLESLKYLQWESSMER
jgi:hypothetical protein